MPTTRFQLLNMWSCVKCNCFITYLTKFKSEECVPFNYTKNIKLLAMATEIKHTN